MPLYTFHTFSGALTTTNSAVHYALCTFFRCSDNHKHCCTLRFVYFFQVLWQPQTLLYITLCGLFQVLWQPQTLLYITLCGLFQVLWHPQTLLYITLCVLFQVLFGNHKRYQDWFQRMYLSTPESQTLRCDLIRFICNCIHPTNKQIESKIMPRWAVIGWLLTTCTVSSFPVSSHCALHDHR